MTESPISVPVEKRVSEFLWGLRGQMDVDRGNVVAMVVGEVSYYFRVLRRVLERYGELNRRFMESNDEFQATLSTGTSEVTDEQSSLLAEQIELGEELRQEIEAFYLFARILLDKMTQAFVACLGAGDWSQTSHRRFAKSIGKYVDAKGLKPVPAELTDWMDELESSLIDFRDDAVVHAKSPRGSRVFGWHQGDRQTYIVYTRLYPKESDKQLAGLPPTALIQVIEGYAEEWLRYLMDAKEVS